MNRFALIWSIQVNTRSHGIGKNERFLPGDESRVICCSSMHFQPDRFPTENGAFADRLHSPNPLLV